MKLITTFSLETYISTKFLTKKLLLISINLILLRNRVYLWLCTSKTFYICSLQFSTNLGRILSFRILLGIKDKASLSILNLDILVLLAVLLTLLMLTLIQLLALI